MNKLAKRVITLLLASVMVFGVQALAFAAEDDIVDESIIYIDEFAMAAQEGVEKNRVVEGTRNTDISNSPAIAGSDNIIVNSVDNVEKTEVQTAANNSPATGAATSMTLPIGVALISLGCAMALWKKGKR